MSVSLLEHKGKEILLIDYTSCKTPDEMLIVLKKSEDFVRKLPLITGLHLIDVTNAPGSRKYMDAAKKSGEELFNELAEKVAIVGVEGIKKVLLMGYNKITKNKLLPFSSREEALDFLVKK